MNTNGLHPVVQQHIGHIEFSIVNNCLIQRLLRKRYRLGFALDEHQRLHRLVIDDCIASLLHFAHLDSRFDCYERGRKAKLLHQPVKQLLAHPLLGCQTHPTMTPLAKDLLLIVVNACTHCLLQIVIFERTRSVKNQMIRLRVVIDHKVTLLEELEVILHLGVLEGCLHFGVHYLQAVGVQ